MSNEEKKHGPLTLTGYLYTKLIIAIYTYNRLHSIYLYFSRTLIGRLARTSWRLSRAQFSPIFSPFSLFFSIPSSANAIIVIFDNAKIPCIVIDNGMKSVRELIHSRGGDEFVRENEGNVQWWGKRASGRDRRGIWNIIDRLDPVVRRHL